MIAIVFDALIFFFSMDMLGQTRYQCFCATIRTHTGTYITFSLIFISNSPVVSLCRLSTAPLRMRSFNGQCESVVLSLTALAHGSRWNAKQKHCAKSCNDHSNAKHFQPCKVDVKILFVSAGQSIFTVLSLIKWHMLVWVCVY